MKSIIEMPKAELKKNVLFTSGLAGAWWLSDFRSVRFFANKFSLYLLFGEMNGFRGEQHIIFCMALPFAGSLFLLISRTPSIYIFHC